jgi:NADH-quinone oxidoreductase subunit L
MHDEQDMRRMGGLFKVMRITSATFLVGWLAISGIIPFAGFWSKDEILLAAYGKSPILWFVGLLTAMLTAFYMSRQVFMVFFGKPRWDRPLDEAVPELAAEREASGAHEGHGVGPFGEIHPHESEWKLTLPLVVLAFFAATAGLLNLPMWEKTKFLAHWLEPVVHIGEVTSTQGAGTKIGLAAIALAGAVAGILGASAIYLKGRKDLAARIEQPVLANGWFYDATIARFMGGPGRKAFDAVAWFDKHIVDGAVNGVGVTIREGSGRGRLLQTGYVRNYALALALGAIVVVGLLLTKAVTG